MLITIPVSIYAARRIHSTKDYVLAGRHLPFAMALATVFATWFGSDSVLGAGTAFAEGGFLHVMVDPFGAGLCLILIGLVFVPKLYNLNYLTIGDYFNERYGKMVGTLLSLAIIATYFGWTAAQFVAIGVILNVLVGIPTVIGMIIAAAIVLVYTYVGGMWSVSLNDTIQMGMILLGMIAVTAELVWKFGFGEIVASAPPEYWKLTPGADGTMSDWLAYLAAWITLGLGSIPQQDVYQRAMSARSLRVSQMATIWGGILYVVIVLMPLFFGLAARMLHPELLAEGADSQLLLPTLILTHMSFPTQVVFFGALIAAIMSTASAAILAPASLLAQNVIKPLLRDVSDRVELYLMRWGVILIATVALFVAVEEGNIYEIVGSSYSITLVAAFVPMVAGLFTKKANTLGALFAIFFGVLAWQYSEQRVGDDPAIPSIIVGLVISVAGMVIGTALARIVGPRGMRRSSAT